MRESIPGGRPRVILRATIASVLLAFALPAAGFPADGASDAPRRTSPLGNSPIRIRFDLASPPSPVGGYAALPPPIANREGGAFSVLRAQAPALDRLFLPRRSELGVFGCALQGAGAGAQAGLFLGALADRLGGARNDRRSLYWMGAAAIGGAFLGGALGPGSSSWSVRVEFDEPAAPVD
ncbi:MAG: hypothetical protein EHM19_03235 [Candidatus Latescibacterota bacterium]|nr:MAG: hypothetical protein EHM19_03235 [Candidatus Latescibacterota bacterium]